MLIPKIHIGGAKTAKRALTQEGNQQGAGSSAGRTHAPSFRSDFFVPIITLIIATGEVQTRDLKLEPRRLLQKLGACIRPAEDPAPPSADFPSALEPFFGGFAHSKGDFRIQHSEWARVSTKSQNRLFARTPPLN